MRDSQCSLSSFITDPFYNSHIMHGCFSLQSPMSVLAPSILCMGYLFQNAEDTSQKHNQIGYRGLRQDLNLCHEFPYGQILSFSLLYSTPLTQLTQDLLPAVTSQSLLLNARHLWQLLCHVTFPLLAGLALLQLVSL